ncbi:ATP-binding protein [Kitasatospora atroaurantiaca]|uniref:Histidine kinase-like protein n=1 Tax=Kitasatospora atroaurantiaca TaxID=285545 RepID=A0A561EJX2_9ACTN|nr:ATP-binding protein [Kitasatospora atroaurantiaca]TWE15872.1 histidine kinase-like protein [Kitasatospora atroaurantiaca]
MTNSRPHPDGFHHRRPRRRGLRLSGASRPVLLGREFTLQVLSDWGFLPGRPDPFGQDAVDDVLLIASEVLSNACLHAGGPTEMVITVSDRVLRVEVLDADPRAPDPRVPQRQGAPGGHGLHIVQRLSDRWGTEDRDHGKAVWFEVGTARLAAALSEPSSRSR